MINYDGYFITESEGVRISTSSECGPGLKVGLRGYPVTLTEEEVRILVKMLGDTIGVNFIETPGNDCEIMDDDDIEMRDFPIRREE